MENTTPPNSLHWAIEDLKQITPPLLPKDCKREESGAPTNRNFIEEEEINSNKSETKRKISKTKSHAGYFQKQTHSAEQTNSNLNWEWMRQNQNAIYMPLEHLLNLLCTEFYRTEFGVL